jgi:hypothetical protein
VIWTAGLAALVAVHAAGVGAQGGIAYRLESRSERSAVLQNRFAASQLALLEKLNRADIDHLERLQDVVLPASWSDDELSYSVLPSHYASSAPWPKFVVVYLPGQLFGAYEFGGLVRWGPISSGRRNSPTPVGLFALNWRSTGHASTVDPDWFLRWYFNFGNRAGLALHAYSMPGYPASHGCIRLLERDARWLFEWGDPWLLDSTATRVLKPGTPVMIVGPYDFDRAPPWRSPTWLSQRVVLPSPPMTRMNTRPYTHGE